MGIQCLTKWTEMLSIWYFNQKFINPVKKSSVVVLCIYFWIMWRENLDYTQKMPFLLLSHFKSKATTSDSACIKPIVAAKVFVKPFPTALNSPSTERWYLFPYDEAHNFWNRANFGTWLTAKRSWFLRSKRRTSLNMKNLLADLFEG